MGGSGDNYLGVPLFDRERMQHIWHVQKKHIKCIQDLPGVALYTKTGEFTKGRLWLPTYRCARGSASLDSVHLHRNRFIPGLCLSDMLGHVLYNPRIFHNLMYVNVLLENSANSLDLQAYLQEGLHRWNQDRGSAALSTAPSPLRSYTGDLFHCVNRHYKKLFGKKLVPEFCPPSRYTGKHLWTQWYSTRF